MPALTKKTGAQIFETSVLYSDSSIVPWDNLSMVDQPGLEPGTSTMSM